jgi:hypothetical protein
MLAPLRRRDFGTRKMNLKITTTTPYQLICVVLPGNSILLPYFFYLLSFVNLQYRKYAPKLPIMLSREAQAQIAERKEYNNCSYDIWMAHVWRYTPAYTRMRQANFGEVSWLYSLDSDRMLYFLY